jgi:hypothetical protein
MDIKLDLKLEEVNGIISVLMMLQFGQVAELIMKIRNQAIEQVQAAQPAQPETLTPEAV